MQRVQPRLSLVVACLTDLGHDAFAVEDPATTDPRDEIKWLGARVTPSPSTARASSSTRSGGRRARAVLVTPAHQCPTGSVLSPARRIALVEWARDVDGYVIEDDYDAEYRYDRQPVGALQGLAPDRVVYSGTLSKSLAPGMRLGWLVAAAALAEPVVAARHITDHATASLMQAACATFLASGDLDRHLRRHAPHLPRATRPAHRRARPLAPRRDHERHRRRAPGARHAAAGLDEVVVAERALAARVRVYPLRSTGHRHGRPTRPALVLGYGALTPAASERGVRLLADAIAGLESSS